MKAIATPRRQRAGGARGSRRTSASRARDPSGSTSSTVPESAESALVAAESLAHLLKSKPGAGEDGQAIGLFRQPLNLFKEKRATLAQLVERLIRNQQVAGSSPAGGSIFSINYKQIKILGSWYWHQIWHYSKGASNALWISRARLRHDPHDLSEQLVKLLPTVHLLHRWQHF